MKIAVCVQLLVVALVLVSVAIASAKSVEDGDAPQTCDAHRAQEEKAVKVEGAKGAARDESADEFHLADHLRVWSHQLDHSTLEEVLRIMYLGRQRFTPDFFAEVWSNYSKTNKPDDVFIEPPDGKLAYSIDIIRDGECEDWPLIEDEHCDFMLDILQGKVMEHVQSAIAAWHKKGLMQDVPSKVVPCNSFLRSYQAGERQQLPSHMDKQSIITTNILLNDPAEFTGGLLIYPNATPTKKEFERGTVAPKRRGQHVFVEHPSRSQRGDLIIHRSDLLHAVHLKRKSDKRVTWITWWNEECDD
eukprot:TRINITY_DN63791_c0_g1_i1.p1 TRINITY_DN63791_c0_g1~~TRINITY_DN63791_c0_g1_i1.p1  ORF type:complete len:302 (-),score=39.55 TRINITY_DN63791_c0_g1_i1:469-1374(-)